MPRLSVIIITKNEAHNIEACLESVKWADEIIVVDSGSTDGTVDICHKYTDKILVTDWPGYGLQKQRALDRATGEWVLSLDADERIPPALQKEIQETIGSSPPANGFYLPRVSEYCGKAMRFGDWRNDRVLRLFRRTKGRFMTASVHEKILVQGTLGTLKHHIYHFSYPDMDVVIKKMNDYSSLTAAQKKEKNATGGIFKALLHGLWSFTRGYFLRFGFLDGREGFLLAVSNAECSYYRYVKMMYLKK